MKYFKNKKYKYKNFSGISLVEVLVSTTIFSVIALAAISILSVTNRTYTRISSDRIAIDNVNMIMTSISNEMRFGTDYRCVNFSGDFSENETASYLKLQKDYRFDTLSCNAISFIPEDNQNGRIVYYFNEAKSSINQIDYELDPVDSNRYNLKQDQALTSSDFKVGKLSFNISGSSNQDYFQPTVSVSIKGSVRSVSNNSTYLAPIAIQNTISQRVLDN